MSIFDPLVLQGVANGLLAGRQSQIAQQNTDADRAVRQQIASTDLLRAKNEALAPFRTEITRQLQVHDAYRPYHMANLMQQYGTADPSDARVTQDMQTWDRALDPYRQALATDDPTEVARIIQNSLTTTGKLPPVAAVDPNAVIQNGSEVPAVIQTPAAALLARAKAGKLHLDMPGFGTGPDMPAQFGGLTPPPKEEDSDGSQSYASPAAPGDPLHQQPAIPDRPIAGGRVSDGLSPRLSLPVRPAGTLPTILDRTERNFLNGPAVNPPAPANESILDAARRQGVLPGVLGPAAPAVTEGDAAASAAFTGAPGPAAAHAIGAPVIVTDDPANPVFRVPGVGDVPFVSAQRVLTQATADPAVQATAKFMHHITLAASLGPGVDPAVVEKATTAYNAAWATALEKYGTLDKLPSDQLNTLMQAYQAGTTAAATAARGPAEAEELRARAAQERATTSETLAKIGPEVAGLLANNREILSRAGLNGANSQKAIADALKQDADRQHIPEQDRQKWYELHVQSKIADAQRQSANAAWNDSQNKLILDRVKRIDPLLSESYATIMGAGGRGAGATPGTPGAPAGGRPSTINAAKAWIVIKRAEAYPNDPQIQQWRQTALQVLRAATATAADHPELVNGPVPTEKAWVGHDLYYAGHHVTEYLGKTDDDSRKALDSLRAWTAYYTKMQGVTSGSYPLAPGPKGIITNLRDRAGAAVGDAFDPSRSPFAGMKKPGSGSGFKGGTGEDE